ncbi:MAG: hypothetical protein PHP08_04130 [Candidatus Dojkabacteria bacterium]|nr:hypothetical protein [Candidatus Dojkabacteria bacterium]
MAEQKKTKLHTVKAKTLDSILWVVSLIGIFSALIWLIVDVPSGLIFLLTFLIILPPVKKLYNKKLSLRLRYIFIIFIGLWITAFITFIVNMIKQTDFQELAKETLSEQEYRIKPENTDFESSIPTQGLSYNCNLISEISINGEPLSTAEFKQVCEKQYYLDLEDGDNEFIIELKTSLGTLKETLNITFDKDTYDKTIAQEEAEREAEAEAIAEAKAEKVITDYAEENEISKELAEQLLEILPTIDIETDSVSYMSQEEDWANGDRYSFYYNSYQFIIYLDSKGIVDSINLGDTKLYSKSGTTKSADDYMLSTTERSDLKMYSKQLVEAVLKAPSTAEFPGGFFDPFSGWGFGKEGSTYKVSSYVDSQNSFGAMIRSNFYLEFNWPAGEDLEVTKFIFDGETIL